MGQPQGLLGRLEAGLGAVDAGTVAVELLLRGEILAGQFLGALQGRLGIFEVGLDGGDVGAGLLDFLRAAAGQQTVQHRLLGGDLGLGGVDLGHVGGGVQRGQKLPFPDGGPFLDLDALDPPADIEGKVGLADVDVALQHDAGFRGRPFLPGTRIIDVSSGSRRHDDNDEHDQLFHRDVTCFSVEGLVGPRGFSIDAASSAASEQTNSISRGPTVSQPSCAMTAACATRKTSTLPASDIVLNRTCSDLGSSSRTVAISLPSRPSIGPMTPA